MLFVVVYLNLVITLVATFALIVDYLISVFALVTVHYWNAVISFSVMGIGGFFFVFLQENLNFALFFFIVGIQLPIVMVLSFFRDPCLSLLVTWLDNPPFDLLRLARLSHYESIND